MSELRIPGAMFSITFYFTCEHGHVHPIEVKFQGVKPEGLTAEAVTDLRDSIISETVHKHMRPSTQAEIDRHIMSEQFVEDVEEKPPEDGRKFFMAPGVKEAQ